MRGLAIPCAAVVLGLAALTAGTANSAPASLDLLKSATAASPAAEKMHWRGYRHCHWRWGYRRCHGPRHYYRGWGPGIHLFIGPRHHRHWHHRRHFNRHRW
jgi:hypothetical protein